MNKRSICKVTGIFGTNHGAGATFLAIALANCSVSRMHKKTALVGINSNDLCNLLGENYEYHEGLYHFSLLGIEIFSPADLDLVDELKKTFDEIIIDFGFKNNISHDLAYCDKVLISASFSPHRIIPINNYIRDENLNNVALSQKIQLISYGKNNYSISWTRKNKRPLFYIPFISDPLKIPLKDANTLMDLL